ncbi:hypothetical protein D0Z00_003942 [Geotrichum galactomycetum]|uniref:Uncharacterized protein n=1 Tax=Geotrichum galactomycetum TaxID=27317 RepID=A0ACB6UZW7_9ASCO|nr:hypothetical protein D0Z00_003942 [Geotrichum candidum]
MPPPPVQQPPQQQQPQQQPQQSYPGPRRSPPATTPRSQGRTDSTSSVQTLSNRNNSTSSANKTDHVKSVQGTPASSYAHNRNHSTFSVAESTVSTTANAAPTQPRKDPLAALQRGEALERRASRRFSAYQFAKLAHSGVAREGIPDMPPMPSDRSTTSYLPTKTPRSTSRAEITSSTALLNDGDVPIPANAIRAPPIGRATNPSVGTITESSVGETESETHFGKIILFLQIGRSVKKCFVETSELTIPALRLLFIDKFTYSNSEAFPEIYIQDPKSGIRYELDEESLANDVRSGSLLSLNVEVVDEVKKQIDEGLAVLTKHVVDLNNKVSSNSTTITELANSQKSIQESYEKMVESGVKVQASPGIAIAAQAAANDEVTVGGKLAVTDTQKLADVRKEIAIVKQISGNTISELRKTVTDLIKKSQQLQAANALPPPGDSSRSFMERCFKKLSGDSDKLLTDADDLQDIIEALRKDVAQRAVRPDVRKMESVAKELATARQDLQAIEQFIVSEKVGWKKIWERELDKICEEQQTLKLHEDIIVDLFDDLDKAAQTFELVEQCISEQSKSGGPRPLRHVTLPPPVESVIHAKDAVLSEVSALQPNHERRVEAIERAEKLRKKELQIRGITADVFKQELGEFVSDDKLKKSGGVEEVERVMKIREAKTREEAQKVEKLLKKEKKKEKKDKKDKKEKKEKKEKKKKKKESEETAADSAAVAVASGAGDDGVEANQDDSSPTPDGAETLPGSPTLIKDSSHDELKLKTSAHDTSDDEAADRDLDDEEDDDDDDDDADEEEEQDDSKADLGAFHSADSSPTNSSVELSKDKVRS